MIKILLINMRNYLRVLSFQSKWRRLNQHNFTQAINIFPIDNVKVGNFSYGDLRIRCFHDCAYELTIGSFCSIASNVVFLLCAEHDYKRFLTYPLETFLLGGKETGKISKGSICIADDVWIGENCTILSGVTIGQGAIISAGSVVVKDVPPYAVYGNYKILAFRFEFEVIEELIKLDYKKIDLNFIKQHRDFFLNEFALNSVQEWGNRIGKKS